MFAVRMGTMAHKRKDTLVPSPEWWRHLRPFNKRRVSKAERQAAKKDAKENQKEIESSGV